jgi:hypothetical protein
MLEADSSNLTLRAMYNDLDEHVSIVQKEMAEVLLE